MWKLTIAPDLEPMIASVTTNEELDRFPYGMALWPSAIGLAEYIAEQRELVTGRQILELGCGAGLSGIVAASAGGDVTQTDYLSDILTLATNNGISNGIQTRIETLDWTQGFTGEPFDLVIGADVLYERPLHHHLFTLFPKLIKPGGEIWISDPQRPASQDFFDRCDSAGWKTSVEYREVMWQGKITEIVIYVLTR
ncbi:MAG: methyltransferase domain-containing protein [Chthonomonadales bacterium]